MMGEGLLERPLAESTEEPQVGSEALLVDRYPKWKIILHFVSNETLQSRDHHPMTSCPQEGSPLPQTVQCSSNPFKLASHLPIDRSA
jgi:hypothetical protein